MSGNKWEQTWQSTQIDMDVARHLPVLLATPVTGRVIYVHMYLSISISMYMYINGRSYTDTEIDIDTDICYILICLYVYPVSHAMSETRIVVFTRVLVLDYV